MKVKLFTHTDLDGVGCAILFKAILDDKVDITYCDYRKVNKLIMNYIYNECEPYRHSHIFITDISVDEVTAKHLNRINDDPQGPKVVLLDHHATAKWLEEACSWSTVKTHYDRLSIHSESKVKTSGTSLVLDYFKDHHPDLLAHLELNYFTETVRRYDTWDWFEMDDVVPKQYNDLLHILGRNRFVERVAPRLKNRGNKLSFDDNELLMLKLHQESIDKYIDNTKVLKHKLSELVGPTDRDYDIGIVFAEQHTSELGNEICRRNTDIDFVIIINFYRGTFSFRTIKEDVDVGKLAKYYFDGGGHPKAAGSQIWKNRLFEAVKTLYH